MDDDKRVIDKYFRRLNSNIVLSPGNLNEIQFKKLRNDYPSMIFKNSSQCLTNSPYFYLECASAMAWIKTKLHAGEEKVIIGDICTNGEIESSIHYHEFRDVFGHSKLGCTSRGGCAHAIEKY